MLTKIFKQLGIDGSLKVILDPTDSDSNIGSTSKILQAASNSRKRRLKTVKELDSPHLLCALRPCFLPIILLMLLSIQSLLSEKESLMVAYFQRNCKSSNSTNTRIQYGY
ncbi:hypothetical protein TNIN_86031 [Trichonephila inaurata madagascariensis]|uniref:Uncharacterized protein n=1 Tax=Trichonephila inaurata madagascariensis TaxID=2747483 RepID=A0A8X6XCT2_9ARAC|nr:hypothetical protein TNIN_86031 [Trichonephila inaurata madagascariensis]